MDAANNVWVVNNGSDSVMKLSSDGTLLGTYAVGPEPIFIAIDDAGDAWVTNTINDGECLANGSVTELSPDGAIMGTFPAGTNAWGIAIDPGGNLWIVNGLTNTLALAPGTVTELSKTGEMIGSYAAGMDPLDIAIDRSGNIWITNSGASNVTEISSGALSDQFEEALGTLQTRGVLANDLSSKRMATNPKPQPVASNQPHPTPEAEEVFRRWIRFLDEEFYRHRSPERRAEIVRDQLFSSTWAGHTAENPTSRFPANCPETCWACHSIPRT